MGTLFKAIRWKCSIIHQHYHRVHDRCIHAAASTSSNGADPSTITTPSKKPLLHRLFNCPEGVTTTTTHTDNQSTTTDNTTQLQAETITAAHHPPCPFRTLIHKTVTPPLATRTHPVPLNVARAFTSVTVTAGTVSSIDLSPLNSGEARSSVFDEDHHYDTNAEQEQETFDHGYEHVLESPCLLKHHCPAAIGIQEITSVYESIHHTAPTLPYHTSRKTHTSASSLTKTSTSSLLTSSSSSLFSTAALQKTPLASLIHAIDECDEKNNDHIIHHSRRRPMLPEVLLQQQASPVARLPEHVDVWESGAHYKGELSVSGVQHGEGTMSYPNGDIYTGSWFNGEHHGHGVMQYAGVGCYDGEYEHGVRHGQGEYRAIDGHRYVGQWVNDHREGHGTEYRSNSGELLYEGDWRGNVRCGHGVVYLFDSQTRIVGQFSAGQINGVAHCTDEQGRIQYTGVWKDGRLVEKTSWPSEDLSEADEVSSVASTLSLSSTSSLSGSPISFRASSPHEDDNSASLSLLLHQVVDLQHKLHDRLAKVEALLTDGDGVSSMRHNLAFPPALPAAA